MECRRSRRESYNSIITCELRSRISMALKDIVTDQEIYNSSGIDVLKFKKTITDIQDKATKRVTKACPKFTGNINNFLLELGGDK